MIQQTAQADEFKKQLRDSLQRETSDSIAIKIARHENVYAAGDPDDMVYFIENGQIKLLMVSSEGKECLLAIHSDGDIFGELCLSELGVRSETATTMKETTLKRIPYSRFLPVCNATRSLKVLPATWLYGSRINSRSLPIS